MINEDINITPGKIIALWRILLSTNVYEGARIQDLYRQVINSSVMGGGLPLKSSIQLALNYKFLIPKDKKLYLSPYSKKELIPICQDDEPSYLVLRKIYYHIIKDKLVPWIIYFNLDVDIFRISIPNNWLELLEMADLLKFQDKDVQEWWSSLIRVKSEINKEKLNTIGYIGEKLTFDFETQRIGRDSIPVSKRNIIWVSKISDEYGFDILSQSGVLFKKRMESDPIFVEVKSSEISNPKLFTFYITENEWNMAMENRECYYFFCWPGIRTKDQSSSYDKPFIIPSKNIEYLIPKNSSIQSQWVKCRVSLDLLEYSIDH